MRIIHLTSSHPYCDTRIFIRMCSSLAKVGHEVHLIVPRSDINKMERRNGVFIHPIPGPITRFRRMTTIVDAGLEIGAALNGDIYHFHDPEFLRVAPRWQRKLNKPFVYDVHEDYRIKMREKDWLPRFMRTPLEYLVGKVEDHVSRQLAGVVAATPDIAARFLSHPNLITVYNYPLRDELILPVTEAKKESGLFAYVGAISLLRGAREMVKAIGLAGPMAKLALAGKFSPETLRVELASMKEWEQVRERGFLSRSEVGILLSQSCAGLVVLHPTPAYLKTYATKLFEYMAVGLPVIVSDIPLFRSMIGAANCALFVDPRSPESIAGAMRWLLEHPTDALSMGARARKLVIEKYNWEAEIPKLLNLYESIANRWSI